MRFIIVLLALLLLPPWAAGAVHLDRISLPPGFAIHLYAEGLIKPRAMVLGDEGTLFVGSCKHCSDGRLYAVTDEDGDYRADRVRVIDSGLRQPVGVAFRDGALYASAENRILCYEGIEGRLDDPPDPMVITSGFPTGRNHQWRFIAFGPDGKLYVPVGAPCNICDPGLPYTAIHRMNADGSGLEVYARGVRNTVGFDWQPKTGALWFSDNGRDWLGDNRPPDELNRAPVPGLHFGYPYCHGTGIPDPEFNGDRDCREFTAPEQELAPHAGALGIAFYTGRQFPAEYHDQIFIAEHGSWNRSRKIGYRVTLVRLDGDRAVSYEPFAEGWLQRQDNWGRPVDVLVLPDGSLLVSDDQAGVIYRIHHPG